jgi:hypothetical protein
VDTFDGAECAGEFEASLVVGKVYPIVPDPRAAKDALVRVIDE